MKRAISLLLCAVILCLSLTACSGPNADMTEENITKTVEVVETALQKFDIDNLNKYVDSTTLSIILGYAKKHEQFAELGRAIFANLEMEITSIDIENQTVTVSVSNKDLFQAANDFAQQLKSDYSTLQLLAKLNNDTFLDTKLAQLCADIDASGFLPEAVEMTLDIEQGKKNLVLGFNDNAENAVSGGALSAIKGIYGG
ncbi:MAG: hypothetical protein J1E36_02835 [Eubacterium sp.]|nr:hypothetical protein [Eubacterium sp.]